MYNFNVTINGITFTQADFEGLEYLNGLPDSLEALADEVITQASTPWPVSNTYLDPQFHAVTTLNITNSPFRKLSVGDFVIVNSTSSTNYMGAVVTATTPTSVTVEWVHASEDPVASSGPWTIIKTRARLREIGLRVLGWGGIGSSLASNSALLKGPSSRILEVTSGYLSMVLPGGSTNTTTGQFLPGGWNLYSPTEYPYNWSSLHIKPTVCGGVHMGGYPPMAPATLVYGNKLAGLTPFAYGACVVEFTCSTALTPVPMAAYSGLMNFSTNRYIRSSLTDIEVNLPGRTASYIKSTPELPVFLVFSPHTKTLEIWHDSVKLDTIPIEDLAMKFNPYMYYMPGPLASMYGRFNYAQQMWR